MPTETWGYAQPVRYRRRRGRRTVTILTVIAALLAGLGYAGYTIYRHATAAIIFPGCQAGAGADAAQLDPDQAPVAATIAGVAARMGLPQRAVVIAYATALQESKMTDVTYGDLDSVGVFQQRPSQGWGTRAQLEDVAYASAAFFGALVKIPGYAQLPVYQAAQDVQHSADGTAYEQWQPVAQQLAASYTAQPHGVTCWYTPSSSGHPALAALRDRLAEVFGGPGDGPVEAVATAGHGITITARTADGWTVANWLMTNASEYGLTRVGYGGWQWTAALTETSWQRGDPGGGGGGTLAKSGAGGGAGSIVAS